MLRRLRLFLLCLIAAALPLQGVAAVAMMNCDHTAVGPAHHAAGHDHAAMLAQQHGVATHHATPEKSGGSACAACCVGLAIASTLPVIPIPLARATTLRVTDDAPRTGTPPAVLERPPRFLA